MGGHMSDTFIQTRGAVALEPDHGWAAYGYGSEGAQVTGVALDQAGNLYSLDRGGRSWDERNAPTYIAGPVLRRWSPDGQLQDEQGAGIFVMPHSVTPCDDGGVIITDVGLHQVIKLDHRGTVDWTLGTERVASADEDCFSLPTDVALASDGSFFVSDGYGNARILKYSKTGKLNWVRGCKGTGPGEFHLPHSLDIDGDDQIYVADRENARIQKLAPDGSFLAELKSDDIGKPFALCKSGNFLYVADCGFPADKRAAIVVIDLTTGETRRSGKFGLDPGDLLGPHSLVVGTDGAVYVADAVLGLLKFVPERSKNV